MQKHVYLVDLVKSFPTNIFLQNLASIQKRTSPIKFAHLAEESENGSMSNLSTKVRRAANLWCRESPTASFLSVAFSTVRFLGREFSFLEAARKVSQDVQFGYILLGAFWPFELF